MREREREGEEGETERGGIEGLGDHETEWKKS